MPFSAKLWEGYWAGAGLSLEEKASYVEHILQVAVKCNVSFTGTGAEYERLVYGIARTAAMESEELCPGLARPSTDDFPLPGEPLASSAPSPADAAGATTPPLQLPGGALAGYQADLADAIDALPTTGDPPAVVGAEPADLADNANASTDNGTALQAAQEPSAPAPDNQGADEIGDNSEATRPDDSTDTAAAGTGDQQPQWSPPQLMTAPTDLSADAPFDMPLMLRDQPLDDAAGDLGNDAGGAERDKGASDDRQRPDAGEERKEQVQEPPDAQLQADSASDAAARLALQHAAEQEHAKAQQQHNEAAQNDGGG